MQRAKSSAATCRLNGWGVGTVLEGTVDEGTIDEYTRLIRITALGEESILARQRIGPGENDETAWNLDLREWRKVGP